MSKGSQLLIKSGRTWVSTWSWNFSHLWHVSLWLGRSNLFSSTSLVGCPWSFQQVSLVCLACPQQSHFNCSLFDTHWSLNWVCPLLSHWEESTTMANLYGISSCNITFLLPFLIWTCENVYLNEKIGSLPRTWTLIWSYFILSPTRKS
jgi:hypothetical protein